MLKTSLCLMLTTMTILGFGQNITIVRKSDNPNKAINSTAFDYIEKGYDLKAEDYIANLSGFVVNSGESVLPVLFNKFWQQSNELGANAFIIENVTHKSDTIFIELAVYNISDEEFQKIFELYPKNMVYVIGDIDKRQTGKKINFNNQKMTLAPMEFISYQNKTGEDAILNIGGLLGAKVWIRGKENRLPKHLSLSGFGVGPGNYNQLSISFNTGRIYPVDLNFGQFLISVLTEKK